MLGKKIAALAAASLIAVSSVGVAHAAPSASSLSVAPALAAASNKDASELDTFGPGTLIIAAIGLGLIIWGIIELTDSDSP